MGIILSIALIWVIICGFINMVLLYYRSKISLKIKLPKRKKYDDKVDPIYKLEMHEFFSDYYVYRYTIGYNESTLLLILSVILSPYPIQILRYSYFESDFQFYVCDNDKVKDITKPLSEIYEEKLAELMAERSKENKDKTENKKAVENLNKIFEENFE